jgi:Rrf2 family protein
MTLSKFSRYALYAALEMARAGEEPVTVVQVAEPHGIPRTALAKVFQQLVRAGLAVGTRGIGGGYRLARPRTDITVLDVVSVFDRLRTPGVDLLHARVDAPPARPETQTLQQLFDEVDDGVRATLASVTLDTLVRGHSH